jgi:RNA polymerase sigma factor (sigma-70 family)
MPLRQTSSEHWDEPAFRAVFLEYYGRIVGILARLVGDRLQAEEVANDAFWRLYRQPGLRVDGNLGGWLYRTATNLGIDALRAASRRRQHEQAAGSASQTAVDGPLDEVLREEQRRKVREVLASIKPVQAQLLVLRADGFSYKELADVIGAKVTGIGTMLNRAEQEFRKRYLELHPDEEGL